MKYLQAKNFVLLLNAIAKSYLSHNLQINEKLSKPIHFISCNIILSIEK
nr:hypothetical protein [Mucilaginibacter sp. E4BP6]